MDNQFIVYIASIDTDHDGQTLVIGLVVNESVQPEDLYVDDRRIVDCPGVVVANGYGPEAPAGLATVERDANRTGKRVLVVRAFYDEETRDLLLNLNPKGGLASFKGIDVKPNDGELH